MQMQEIIPGLWLSGSNTTNNFSLLSSKNIGAILNCTKSSEVENSFSDRDIKYLRIPIYDESTDNISQYFNIAYDFILENLKKKVCVLVHCQSGISRSPTILMHFLMKHLGWSREYAYERVKEKRSCIKPNNGFLIQLNIPN